MLDTKLIIRCPWCGKSKTLKEWDDLTFSKCTTREMKRSFRSLAKEGTWLKNSNKYFLCGDCDRWLKASQLILESDKPEHKKIGGEPVILSAFKDGEKVDVSEYENVPLGSITDSTDSSQ